MTRAPLFTLLLCSLSVGFMLLPPTLHNVLYFDYFQVSRGNWQGLITGHWVHAGGQHLVWNVSALALLGALIEARSRTLLLVSIAIGTLFVDLLLLSPLGGLQRYCGLSGLLNTLLGVALYLVWRETRSPLLVLTAILCVTKIVLEMQTGQSIFTATAWPPFAQAHLAGILGVPFALMLVSRRRNC